MSEHGDSPDSTIDPDFQARPSRRFARLVESPAVRKLSPRRLTWAVLVSLAVLCSIAIGGVRAVRGLTRWVASQPEHRVDFAAIELHPETPPYLLAKSVGFLDKVREEAKLPESLALLELDLKALSTDFSRNPFVKHVDRVEVSHHRLSVSLVFRKPMAVVEIKGEPPVVVDEDGVILPFDEIEWAEQKPRYRPRGLVEPLIVIGGVDRPTSREPGLLYKTRASAEAKEPCDLDVLKAARLAVFLDHQPRRTPGGLPVPSFVLITPSDEADVEGLFLIDSGQNCVYWGSAPGAGIHHGFSASDKWRLLLEWVDRHGKLELNPGEYLRFDQRKLKLHVFAKKSR